MKLITEECEHIEFITEEKTTNKGNVEKKLYFEGIYFQSDIKNKNSRIYPYEVLFPSIKTYVNEQVNKDRALGELNHPEHPHVNLDNVSHKIISLQWKNKNVLGKALVITETPKGKIVQGLINGGVKLAVSSRGLGALEENNGVSIVKDGYIISAVDVVHDPSAPNAFINGIMEGVEFFPDNEGNWKRKINKLNKVKYSLTEEQIGKWQLKLFKDFLKNI
jgi:hypothetical protein